MHSQESCRYLIGIDLGTTNSSVAYMDLDQTRNPQKRIDQFLIPQMTAPSFWEEKSMLPSFYYCLEDHQATSPEFQEPWLSGKSYLVGTYAKELGKWNPHRLITSAKSWLTHVHKKRHDKFLPLSSQETETKLSPVEVCAAYLKHIKYAWDSKIARGDPEKEFQQQEIIITLPASFDEIARRQTIEAAQMAGYPKISLLEEPQAVFYYWIHKHQKNYHEILKEGSTVLVCDIGGGTTDFSWIQAYQHNQELQFRRLAVGRHLLIGGDNMDRALAHHVEKKLLEEQNVELTLFQWEELLYVMRAIKETLFEDPKISYRIVLKGEGSRLIGGSIQIDIDGDSLRSLLKEGFFAKVSWEEALQSFQKKGLSTEGLIYETESRLNVHIAQFLKNQSIESIAIPDFILFNGGALNPIEFQEQILSCLEGWGHGKRPSVLENKSLDLSVSKGAVYYAASKRGWGRTIYAGIAKTYYLEMKDEQNDHKQALVIVPRSVLEGSEYVLTKEFDVIANEKISFKVYSSQTRLHDELESLVDVHSEEMTLLPPIQTILKFGKKQERQTLRVVIKIVVTDLGILEVFLKSTTSDHEWLLEFQLRGLQGEEASTLKIQSRHDETFSQDCLLSVKKMLEGVFIHKNQSDQDLVKQIEQIVSVSKQKWPISFLRWIVDELLSYEKEKERSSYLKIKWWNLIGYCLRPGFGFPLDDVRMKKMWGLFLSQPVLDTNSDIHIQQLICYRRLSGGFNKGQQGQILSKILPEVYDKKKGAWLGSLKKNPYLFEQRLRCIASFEYLDLPTKMMLGKSLKERLLERQSACAEAWSLGRLGSRRLLYGGVGDVIPSDVCTQWLEDLLDLDLKTPGYQLMFYMLTQETPYREKMISQEVKKKIFKKFSLSDNHKLEHLDGVFDLEQGLLGDEVPCGLKLVL